MLLMLHPYTGELNRYVSPPRDANYVSGGDCTARLLENSKSEREIWVYIIKSINNDLYLLQI